MTLTISPPCLESTEFLLPAEHVSTQVPTLDEGDTLEGVGSSWTAGAALILPILPSLGTPSPQTCEPHLQGLA